MAATDAEFLKKLNEAFSAEAQEHLQALTTGLLELESGAGVDRQQEIVEGIFREAHSLKGAARSVSRGDIEAVCQEMESVFAQWKKQGLPATPVTFDQLSYALDFLARLLTTSESSAGKKEVVECVQQLRNLSGAPAATPSSVMRPEPSPEPEQTASVSHEPAVATSDTVRISTAKMDSLLLQAEEMIAVKNTSTQRALELHQMGRMMETWRKEWTKTDGQLEQFRKFTTQNATTIPTALFDFLEWNQSYIHSLETRISSLEECADKDRRFIGGMVDALLNDAKQLVMMPFSTLLDIFPKQVRDLAREQGKEIELSLRGREIEIDKRILEQMKDPLVHLVRNAIDHGIEKPAMRAERQKPSRGTLTIAVAQLDASKVEIIVSDDGQGIDVEEVKAAALRSGAITAEEARQRTAEDALPLIFQSGISTSAIITEISGRGLGMAIVREKVEKLGGQIEMENEPGRGASFRIILPVTLATFKGLLVSAGSQQFILPISNIERVLRIPHEAIKSVENKATISWDGKAVSLARLDVTLGLPLCEKSGDEDCVQVAILSAGETRIAFVIEEVLDEQEVLVKPLQKPLVRIRHIAAATILGSGKTVLILNVPDLLKSAIASAGTARESGGALAKPAVKAASILVIDDSVTSRMLLKNILEAAGFDVKTAIDGMDAWTALKTHRFDLVVSDVEMPRMDGFGLTEKIRADKRLSEMPVVLVTALESREHRERGIDVGANAYIVKSSFDQSDLLEIVRRFI